MKKMKKRRELDALVNGKANRGRSSSKKGQGLLLEDFTDSSDIEEFSMGPTVTKSVPRKRGFVHFCKSCLTVCSFFMLLSCVVAIIGLILVYNELKGEIERDKKTVATLSQKLDDIMTINNNIDVLNHTLLTLTTKIDKVKVSLENQDAESPKLKKLSDAVSKLTQSVAKLGSNQDNLKTEVEAVKKAQVPQSTPSQQVEQLQTLKLNDMEIKLKNITQHVHNLERKLFQVFSNSSIQSFSHRLTIMENTITSQQSKVIGLENITMKLEQFQQNLSKREQVHTTTEKSSTVGLSQSSITPTTTKSSTTMTTLSKNKVQQSEQTSTHETVESTTLSPDKTVKQNTQTKTKLKSTTKSSNTENSPLNNSEEGKPPGRRGSQ